MILPASGFLIGLVLHAVSASVTLRKTSRGPTGYEVDFSYFNATATNVTVGGGLYPFTDEFHTSTGAAASYDPHSYKPGWFPSVGSTSTFPRPYSMSSDGKGNWNYTTPLPSGTYSYAFLVDCANVTLCTVNSTQYVIDFQNPPFVNVPGDQIQSTFQVPYDPKFQYYPDMGLQFDYALPVVKQHRGSISTVNYTSPGSIHPAPDVHDFALYLPEEYGACGSKKYPLLYLSHGSGGNGEDWENLAQVSNILDALILAKYIPPTVVVMPSFYNLAPEYQFTYGVAGSVAPSVSYVRENYMKYLFPWVQSHYNVSRDPSMRAFAGLSLGSVLTYEMYINATGYFDYYGMFSGALGPFATPSAYINSNTTAANPGLIGKGLFTGAGLYDIAFGDVRSLQTALDTLKIPHVSRIAPYGFHYWNTWQDLLWHFGQKALWQSLPFNTSTGLYIPQSPIM